MNSDQLASLVQSVCLLSKELGFQRVGVSGTDLATDERRLKSWLASEHHGTMGYMQSHGNKRSRPQLLRPGTQRVISLAMDYLPQAQDEANQVLANPHLGYISRYALGRDYHKVVRQRLKKLAKYIDTEAGFPCTRIYVDSAPVLEKPLAREAGLGWIGKHTNLIRRTHGSWFFLGEIYTDIPLPTDQPAKNHCGTCRTCLDVCPTKAIVAPYHLDARRCISYLTIEYRGVIPIDMRPQIGNRIYGCDDCQLACPWNRFSQPTLQREFAARDGLEQPPLVDLFRWSEQEFYERLKGSPIRRIGYEAWLRNIAVALGNSPAVAATRDLLRSRLTHQSKLVREHVLWALSCQDRQN